MDDWHPNNVGWFWYWPIPEERRDPKTRSWYMFRLEPVPVRVTYETVGHEGEVCMIARGILRSDGKDNAWDVGGPEDTGNWLGPLAAPRGWRTLHGTLVPST